MPAARAGAECAPMSASRVWISAMRCGSRRGLGLGQQRACARVSAASTISIRRLGPVGRFLRQPRRCARAAADVIAPCSGAMSPAMARNSVRLAGAVAADEADARAGRHLRGRALDQEAPGDAQAKDRRSPASAWYGRNDRQVATDTCVAGRTGCQTGRCCRHNRANRRDRPGRGGAKGDAMCVAGCERAVRDAMTRRGFFSRAGAAGFVATAVPGSVAMAAPRSFTKVVDLTHTMSPIFRLSTASRASRCSGNSRSRRTATTSTGGA